MAKITVPININGLDFVIKILKEFDDRFEFKNDVSEEFKDGFNLCKNIMITVLEKLENGGYE